MPPLPFHDDKRIRQLDPETRRRAWRIALRRAQLYRRADVWGKCLVLIAIMGAVLMGPLQAVHGAWIPMLIACPFVLPFLLRSEYEKHVRPKLMEVVDELSHSMKASF